MMRRYLVILLSILSSSVDARTLEVGPFREYLTLQQAAAVAQPGDTILLFEAIHSGGESITNLQGTANAWITIRSAPGAHVLYRGNSHAFHLIDPAYVRIEGLNFEAQTGNGVNIDDAATFETPAHHIVIDSCTWWSMNATGNNDQLKLSGVDSFIISRSRFMNGAAGGSCVDMVGCHSGLFVDNYFAGQVSSGIQAKGGSKDIRIERNHFYSAGQRAINIGGSTGLQFFRPPGINYEASNIYVYSNLFERSTAPIAFVGAVNSEVVNNTIVQPERWAVRILQETVEPGFLPCGNNTFRNNIVWFESAQPAINVGGNTAPETFTFSHNLWFKPGNPSWVPDIPGGIDAGSIVGQDPEFLYPPSQYDLKPTSVAIGAGYPATEPDLDFYGRPFREVPSMGAIEFVPSMGARKPEVETRLRVWPNPAVDEIRISGFSRVFTITNTLGDAVYTNSGESEVQLSVERWPAGVYHVRSEDGQTTKFIKH